MLSPGRGGTEPQIQTHTHTLTDITIYRLNQLYSAEFNLRAPPNSKTLRYSRISMFPQFAELRRHLEAFIVEIAEIVALEFLFF